MAGLRRGQGAGEYIDHGLNGNEAKGEETQPQPHRDRTQNREKKKEGDDSTPPSLAKTVTTILT